MESYNFIFSKGKQSTVSVMGYSVLGETTVIGENTGWNTGWNTGQNRGNLGIWVNKTSAEITTRVMTLKEFLSLAHFELLEYI